MPARAAALLGNFDLGCLRLLRRRLMILGVSRRRHHRNRDQRESSTHCERETKLFHRRPLSLHRFLHLGTRSHAVDIGFNVRPFAEVDVHAGRRIARRAFFLSLQCWSVFSLSLRHYAFRAIPAAIDRLFEIIKHRIRSWPHLMAEALGYNGHVDD